MKKTFLLFGVLLAFGLNTKAQTQNLTISERVTLSDTVLEGKVISQTSQWDETQSRIFTVSEIEVYKKFKGTIGDQVYVITEGGIVGNDFQIIPHSPQFGMSQEGIFFLEQNAEAELKPARLENPTIRYQIKKNSFFAVDASSSFGHPAKIYNQIESNGEVFTEKIASNTIEKNIEQWLNSNLLIESTTDILIEFSFENIELVGTDKVEFDIMAKSNQEGIKFAASDVYISYSTEAFGENIVANDKIEATKETVIENEVYNLQLTDESAQIVKFLVNAGFEPDELYSLSQITEKFIHVKLDIADVIQLASLSFDDFLMANQSLFYDEEAGEFVGFDKIAVESPIFPFLVPQIETIAPNPVPAGTRIEDDILTITGTMFGNHNLTDGSFDMTCTDCQVRFKDSDNPFSHIYARGKDIISWLDDEIRLNIPSATGIGGPYQHSAASGEMRVESPTGNSNEVDIDIPYSVLNFQSSEQRINPAKRFASQQQTSEGIIFNYHENVVGGKKIEADRAFSKWCDKTSIGWKISDTILDDSNISGLLSGTDQRNVISVQPDSEFPSSNARAFVKITGHFGGCGDDNIVYIRDVDVAINNDDFDFDDADNWYNYVLHELGHAHLLYHSIYPEIDPTSENQHIMYFDVTLINNIGVTAGNMHRHPVQNVDEEGAETVFPSSANLLVSCDAVNPITALGCSGLNSTNQLHDFIKEVYIFPNPTFDKNLFLYLHLEKGLIVNLDLYNSTGKQIHKLGEFNTSPGENTIPLGLISNVPKGSYILKITSEKGNFFSKFIRL